MMGYMGLKVAFCPFAFGLTWARRLRRSKPTHRSPKPRTGTAQWLSLTHSAGQTLPTLRVIMASIISSLLNLYSKMLLSVGMSTFILSYPCSCNYPDLRTSFRLHRGWLLHSAGQIPTTKLQRTLHQTTPKEEKTTRPETKRSLHLPVQWEMPRVRRSLWSCACPGQICLGDPWQLTGLCIAGVTHGRWMLLMNNVQRCQIWIWYWDDEMSQMDPNGRNGY